MNSHEEKDEYIIYRIDLPKYRNKVCIFLKKKKTKEESILDGDYVIIGSVLKFEEFESLVEIKDGNTYQIGNLESFTGDFIIGLDGKPILSAKQPQNITECFGDISSFLYESRVQIKPREFNQNRIFRLMGYESTENPVPLVVLNYLEYMFINIFEIEIPDGIITQPAHTNGILNIVNAKYNKALLDYDVWNSVSKVCSEKIFEITSKILKIFAEGYTHQLDFDKLPKFKMNLTPEIKREINTIYQINKDSTFDFMLGGFFDIFIKQNKEKFLDFSYFLDPVVFNERRSYFVNKTIRLCLEKYDFSVHFEKGTKKYPYDKENNISIVDKKEPSLSGKSVIETDTSGCNSSQDSVKKRRYIEITTLTFPD